MFQRKPRRFRRRPTNGRSQHSHSNGHMQPRLGSNSFSNNQPRNNFRTTQSPEKLLEKYNTLAKEAISAGDKTLGENYLQHADHFMRIIEDKNKIRNQNSINQSNVIKAPEAENELSTSNESKQEETNNLKK